MSHSEGVEIGYTTDYGTAYRGDSRDLMRGEALDPESVDLIFTSPPFALTRPKDYGNKSQGDYLSWFETFIAGFKRVLAPTGSLVIDIGGSYESGSPIRSTYHFELAVMLSKHFEMCQEFYWYNPAKLPTPAQWTNIERSRVKDSVNLVLWLAKDAAKTKAHNRRVLKAYSKSMKSLLKSGYQVRKRPSNHDISDKFAKDNNGAIPPNLLGFAPEDAQGDLLGEPFDTLFDNLISIANTASSTQYLQACKEAKLKPHPARFPMGLPAFFIQFLTEPRDLVFDPFAGSNTTGDVAQRLGRHWAACDIDEEQTYLLTSSFRFPDIVPGPALEKSLEGEWDPEAYHVGPQES